MSEVTHNERILAGALMVILSAKAMDSHETDNTDLMKMGYAGYRMMGIEPSQFLHGGVSYRDALFPAIRALYEKFAIIEQVMDS